MSAKQSVPQSMSFTLAKQPTNVAQLVEEEPISISVNGVSISVMMASPYDLPDLIYGLFLTEKIVQNCHEIKDIDITKMPLGFSVDVEITGRREFELKHKKRLFMVGAGCGLCNSSALDEAFPAIPALSYCQNLDTALFTSLRSIISASQHRAAKTGALHAAMFITEQQNSINTREDIGRHNALDKIIGYVYRNKMCPSSGYLVVTSRCGAELVKKAAITGFATLISLSSPSQFAVALASSVNMNLIYLPRNNQPVYFSRARSEV